MTGTQGHVAYSPLDSDGRGPADPAGQVHPLTFSWTCPYIGSPSAQFVSDSSVAVCNATCHAVANYAGVVFRLDSSPIAANGSSTTKAHQLDAMLDWRANVKTAARSVLIRVVNDTDEALLREDYGLVHGKWSCPPPEQIEARSTVDFATQSDGFMIGTEGCVAFQARTASQHLPIVLHWCNPWVGQSVFQSSAPPGYVVGTQEAKRPAAEVSYVVTTEALLRDSGPESVGAAQVEDGVPVCLDGEAICVRQAQTSLVNAGGSTVARGDLFLTSHRIIVVCSTSGAGHALQLLRLARVEGSGGLLGSKITLNLMGSNDAYVLSLKNRNVNTVLDPLKTSLRMRSWRTGADDTRHMGTSTFSTRGAGVSGLIRSVEQRASSTDKNLEDAFADMDALMRRATTMVGLANRFRKELDKKKTGEEDADGIAINNTMRAMGMANPVTRELSGAGYHQDLGRQMGKLLLEGPMASGMALAVGDIYCLINRARGTDLVSPEDVLRSCELFPSLGLDLQLRKFPSGVLVVERGSNTDKGTVGILLEESRKRGSLRSADAAEALGCTLMLAKELLLSAERAGSLCRDESVHGISFYPNFFLGVS